MSQQVDAVVVGGGIGGLVAAHTLVERGLRTVVLEASTRLGGPVRGGSFESMPRVPVDLGAESFASRGTAVGELAAELGLDVVEPAPLSAWGYAAGRAFPLPKAGVLGIPATPWAADVRAAVGWAGALRGSLDRVLPRFVGAHADDLGSLVRARLGRRVTDRLVAPVAGGVHSAPLDRLAVSAVAPGLADRFAVEGSLTRAVGALRAAAPAGSAVRGIDGGVHAIVEALAGQLAASAELWTDSPVTDATGPIHTTLRLGQEVVGIERSDDGGWAVRSRATSAGVAGGRGSVHTVTAPRLVVTTPAVGPLLEPWTGVVPRPEPGADVRLVTLLLDAPELDAAPRGSGMLVAPGATEVRAKALTHATAKWPWLARRVQAAAGADRHVVRLSYGRIGETTAVPDAAEAARDASELFGIALTDRVVDHLHQRWDGALPPPTPAYRADVTALSAAVGQTPGLAVTGGWVAGTGLAAIVAHAQAAVGRL
ncbi:protoporphyrinogen/coproporphyrinogen oxidase [Isoptericola aurantiacus]|uniref:protoporphyrinogen/coproporphyrinogen oxidase n=1 Tax=Isoptericola aurantiacus TaxID=3377839 RepID=UPI00383B843F